MSMPVLALVTIFSYSLKAVPLEEVTEPAHPEVTAIFEKMEYRGKQRNMLQANTKQEMCTR
jgi:hypothetical protein